MKRQIIALVGLALLTLLTGCPPVVRDGKSDAVTTILKENKYAPIVPISDGHCLGDVIKTPSDLTPVLNINNDMPEVYSRIVESNSIRPENICLPEMSGNGTFELNANADVIGAVQGQLRAAGARRFRVKIEDPCAYGISDFAFRTVIFPELVKRDPDTNYIGMYVVAALLKVKSIEYELTDEKDVNIKVSSDAIKYVSNAGLGVAGGTNGYYKLYTSRPGYIGWKLYQINASHGFGQVTTLELAGVLRTKPPESMQLKEVKLEGLHKAQATSLESIQAKETNMKELYEVQTQLSASVQVNEAKIETLRKAQDSPSKSVTTEVKTEELRKAQAELSQSKAKMEELQNKQAELSKSVLAEGANMNALLAAQADLSQSILADEAKIEELQKARAKLAESIVLKEVPIEELRKGGAK
ncbi:MAG: hypothetical protein ABSG97_09370 [Sedimentisphaerales bacterium]|jgi:hypothetical protein